MDGSIIVLLILAFGILILMVVSQWKIYTKAGKPGWAVLVPIYSTLVLLEIIKKPWYWLFLIMFLPFIYSIWATNLLAKSFGKTTGFTLGLLFFPYIFYPILAFDKSAQYIYGDNSNDINEIGTPEVA